MMATKTSLELHHHFPKLAEESGFTFNTHRARVRTDWHKMRSIDIDSLIREKKFFLIEQHLNDILNCVLDSEFDVRILDEGVLNMFRLAQLAVEYQQFCRQYLDRSVFVLREEISSLIHELDIAKKDLNEKEEEIRKLRKKSKQIYRPTLPYGNDNIATMILKTLSNKTELFPSTSNVEALQYNKCRYCDKVFLNQLYLKSHLSRRHPNVTETPQKDVTENDQNLSSKENTNLNEEVMELKTKLKEMETLIATTASNVENKMMFREVPNENHNEDNQTFEKKTKDAEVSTNEDYLMGKIEEWKREEHERYNKELNLLRTQIMESINSFKQNEVPKPLSEESNLITQLQTTIKQQVAEILALKQELTNSILKSKNEEAEKRKEIEEQISFWTIRTETQTKQYEQLLQKLNEVAQEAHDSRALADTERQRALQMQAMLHQSLHNQPSKADVTNHVKDSSGNSNTKRINMKKKSFHKSSSTVDRTNLEKLHRKAQELLNIGSTSSSELSSASIEKAISSNRLIIPKNINKAESSQRDSKEIIVQSHKKRNLKKEKIANHVAIQNNAQEEKIKQISMKKEKPKSSPSIAIQTSIGSSLTPGSPIKVVRAKLTEEVNNRLVTVGVDPLKSELPRNVFRKQIMQLQQIQEMKSKSNPDYQRVRHTLLAHLDSNTAVPKRGANESPNLISPSKMTKAFSLTSVISNVKSRALSLVKSNDFNMKAKRNSLNAEVAKKALVLLKTPPGSTNSSPVTQRSSVDSKANIESPKRSSNVKPRYNTESSTLNKRKHPTRVKEIITAVNDSDTESSKSDHKYYNSAIVQQASKSIENLIKSPARRPFSANADYKGSSIRKYTIDSGDANLVRSQSATNVSETKSEAFKRDIQLEDDRSSSDDMESLDPMKKTVSVENMPIHPKQTKGVLKNASSTSSLNKKKVLFDMDAIQMKSVSASPSQSTTEKSDGNEKFELGLTNLDGEEWDISSIENDPLKEDTKIQINTRTSPKIAELKQTIESQLARRNMSPSTALAGSVDVLTAPMNRAASIGGSNTSLGSSILDESETMPVVNHKAFVKPRKVTEKDDSDIDISEYSLDSNKKGNDSF